MIACCRDLEQSIELRRLAKQLPNITLETLEITNPKQIQNLAYKIMQPIDILLLNAGIKGASQTLSEINAEDMLTVFDTNVVGQLSMIQYFADKVTASYDKQIVVLSSKMGSIDDNRSGGSYSYRASKAALNIVMKSVAIDLAPQGVHVLILHPGWVKTRMNGSDAPLDTFASVSGMINIINNYKNFKSGSFRDYKNQEIPW